jgi:hypothetical protein
MKNNFYGAGTLYGVVRNTRRVEPMTKTVWGSSLIFTLLFSAAIGAALVNLATANPIGGLPTIIIKSDGSVVPDTPFIKQNGDVYTLTGDIQQEYSITIQRSNMIFDGAGYSVNVSSYPVLTNIGLSLEGVTNVTVKDITVTGFSGGYSDRMLGDVVAQNTTNSALLRVATEVLLLENSNFNMITESNISSENSLRPPELSLLSSNNNTITRNNIANSLSLGGYNNTFFKNNFSIEQLIVNGGNFWDNVSVGNYWSDYNGTDSDGDGVGDVPYVIDENNQDNYPLMAPFEALPSPEPQPGEPVPTILILASLVTAAVVGLGLFVYFKKRKS